MSHFSFQWSLPKFSSRWFLVQLILTPALEADVGVLTSVPPQRPSFHLSVLCSCFIDVRFSHTIASFYKNGKHPLKKMKQWGVSKRSR